MKLLKWNDLAEELDHKPVSGTKLKEMAGVDVLLEASVLLKYRSMEDLFNTHGDVVLMIWLQTKTFGHFTVLIRNKHGIEFYEPYGMGLTKLFKLSGETRSRARGINPVHALLPSKKKLHVNHDVHQLRTKGDYENTCSYHIAMRVAFRSLSNDEYNSIVTSAPMIPDHLAIAFSLKNFL